MAKLFPTARISEKGFLLVGQGHRLRYETCGNPKGKPVIVLHGGPGGSISKKHRQFLNPKRFRMIFFDQRGSGKSTPKGSIKANKTSFLVEDIKKILEHFGIKKVLLFGGSWGSALALCYAIKYPETVAGMVLRGIFLISKEDEDYAYNGPAKFLFPEEHEKFISLVPKSKRKRIEKYFFRKMSKGSKKQRQKFAKAFLEYEQSIMSLHPKKKNRKNQLAAGLIESYYLANGCFLPKNYILRNASNLSGIPTAIIHGRYDLVCPPSNAIALHKKIKNSKLFFTAAGHSSSDKETEEKIVEETEKIGKKIKW